MPLIKIIDVNCWSHNILSSIKVIEVSKKNHFKIIENL